MGQSVFSVSEAIRRVNRVLDRQVRHVAVRGELSGVKRASSGHVYFRLKDDDGVLDAAFFRHRAAQLGYPLRDGIEVICRGPLTILHPKAGSRWLWKTWSLWVWARWRSRLKS